MGAASYTNHAKDAVVNHAAGVASGVLGATGMALSLSGWIYSGIGSERNFNEDQIVEREQYDRNIKWYTNFTLLFAFAGALAFGFAFGQCSKTAWVWSVPILMALRMMFE